MNTRPAEPLVTLRAVGRHVEKIAALPPYDIAEQLVDFLVRAGKMPCALHIGMYDDCAEIVGSNAVGRAVDAYVAETHKGVVRAVALMPAAADVLDALFCRAQARGVKIAVCVEDFRVRIGDALAVFCGHVKLNITGHILSEINDTLAVRGGEHLHGRNHLVLAHNFALLRDKRSFGRVENFGRLRVFGADARVENLAVIYRTLENTAFANAPAAVGHNHLLAAVRKANLKRGNQRGKSAPDVVEMILHERTAEPPAPDRNLKPAVAFEHICYVVALVLVSAVICRPAGRENEIADHFAVDARLVHTRRRYIKICRANLLIKIKLAKIQRTHLAEIRFRAYPPRGFYKLHIQSKPPFFYNYITGSVRRQQNRGHNI